MDVKNAAKLFVAVVFGLVVYQCTQRYEARERMARSGEVPGATSTAAPTPAQPPAMERTPLTADVISSNCSEVGRHTQARATIINTSAVSLEFAKVYFEFLDASGTVVDAQDSYVRPTTLPAGSRGSSDSYASTPGVVSCRIAAIQDRDGTPVVIRQVGK